nr:ABC transporter permease [Streptomyces sp. Ag109_O5-10]
MVLSEALLLAVVGLAGGARIGWALSETLVKVLTGVFDPPPAALSIPGAYLALTRGGADGRAAGPAASHHHVAGARVPDGTGTCSAGLITRPRRPRYGGHLEGRHVPEPPNGPIRRPRQGKHHGKGASGCPLVVTRPRIAGTLNRRSRKSRQHPPRVHRSPPTRPKPHARRRKDAKAPSPGTPPHRPSTCPVGRQAGQGSAQGWRNTATDDHGRT